MTFKIPYLSYNLNRNLYLTASRTRITFFLMPFGFEGKFLKIHNIAIGTNQDYVVFKKKIYKDS